MGRLLRWHQSWCGCSEFKECVMTKKIKKTSVISEDKKALIRMASLNKNYLGKLIERAKQGDKSSSRDLVAIMVHYLLHEKVQKPTFPPVLSQYLLKAFSRILADESADVAFNLKKNGRPQTPHQLKLWVSHYVYERVHEDSLTVEKAVAETVDYINSIRNGWVKSQLGGIELKDEGVRKWYYETLEELNSIYQQD
jgi:hypothetical protein